MNNPLGTARRCLMVVAVLGLLALVPRAAWADDIKIDGDLASPGNQNTPAVNARPGETVQIYAGIAVSFSGQKHLAAAAGKVKFTVSATKTTLPVPYTVDPLELTVPANWSDSSVPMYGLSLVSFVAPLSLGTASYIVKWDPSPAGPDTYTCVDGNGNTLFNSDGSYSNECLTGSDAITIKVNVADPTPPVITPAVSGTMGRNGWYTSDVTLTWNVSDPDSSISSTTGCGEAQINTDTPGATYTCTASSAGGTASSSITIKRDATPPTAVLTVSGGAAGNNGWYTSDVTVSTLGSDITSSPVICTVDQFQTTETGGQVFNGACTNDAGLVTQAVPLTVKLDKALPRTAIQLTAPAVPGGVYRSDVTVILTVSNTGGSGIASTRYSLNGGSAMTYTSPFTVSSTISPTISFWSEDNAGNLEATRSETVEGRQNFPVLTSVVSNVVSGTVRVRGTILVPPNSALPPAFGVFLFTKADCTKADFGAARQPLGRVLASRNSSGMYTFDQVFDAAVPEAMGVSATTSSGRVYFSTCRLATTGNSNWFTANRLQFQGSTTAQQYILNALERKWFRFPVQPGSKVTIKLTGSPGSAITLHRDPRPIYLALGGTPNAVQASAEAAGSKFLPSDYLPSDYLPSDYLPSDYLPSDYLPSDYLPSDYLPSDYLPSDFLPSDYLPSDFLPSDILPSDFLPSDYLPSDFLPSDFLPSDYLPSDYLPSDFLPSDFLPSDFLPSDFLPSDFLPSDFLPSDYLPSDFLPSDFLPSDYLPSGASGPFQPAAYSGATARSLMAFSMYPNSLVQTIERNTYDLAEDLYVRVVGPYDPARPFTLQVSLEGGMCSGIRPVAGVSPAAPSIAGLKTLILTDSGRLPGTASEVLAAKDRLGVLAARSDVAGVVVDLKDSARVAAANAQADANTACPAAKNLVAGEIKRVVDSYRTANSTIQYVVLAGGAGVIPYFQTPDTAGLGSEQGYVPPVRASTASEAGLAWSLVQGQDYYGSSQQISLGDHAFYVPDLAVGRLVDTAADIRIAVDAAIATNLSVTPRSALVTGYDFVADGAQAARAELELGTASPADTLISNTWSASQVRAILLGARHDIALFAGHFSSGRLLAADYTTSISASEITAASVDLTNSLVMVLGCHGGYTIPLADEWAGATPDPDWAKAFLRKGVAGYVAATGYAYGDTDFVEYGERLIVNLTQELRRGVGPVSIGKALVQAKKAYMTNMASPMGIDEKTLVEIVLYGLPMMQVNMPGERIPTPASSSLVSGVAPSQGPGSAFGLREAGIGVTPQLTAHTVPMRDLTTDATVNATYLSGKDGLESDPFQPVLPKELYDVSVTGNVLRGFAFRGGTFSESSVLPFTSAPTTEDSQPHPAFSSDVFYPTQPWQANFFEALSGGSTRILALPAQLKSATPDSTTNITLRQFRSLQFRLYYLDSGWPGNLGVKTAASAAAPTILKASALPAGSGVKFQVRVQDDKIAGIQAVWVLYTGLSAGLNGRWQPLDLTRSGGDPSLWEGTLAGVDPADILFMVQAVNGTGLSTLDSNLGAFYSATVPASGQVTSLNLVAPTPTSGGYLTRRTFTARLLDASSNALQGQTVVFTLGGQSARATTDASGIAIATMPVVLPPGVYGVGAYFRGTAGYLASYASADTFTVLKVATTLTLLPSAGAQYSDDSGVTAVLRDDAGRGLRGGRSVLFQVAGSGGTYWVVSGTDFRGNARLGAPNLPAGAYTVSAKFLGDQFYFPSPQAVGSLNETQEISAVTYTGDTVISEGSPLNLKAVVVQQADDWPGDLSLAQVQFRVKDSAGALVASADVFAGAGGGVAATIPSIVDSGTYAIEAQVVGGYFASPLVPTTLIVNNVPPVLGQAAATTPSWKRSVAVAVSFTDVGALDTHAAVWEWGDSSSSPGVVNESGGSGNVQGSHTYASDGTYTIKVTVTDKDSGSGTSVFQYRADETPPVTVAGGLPAGWSNAAVVIALTATDNLSGVWRTYYSLDGGAQQAGTSLTVDAEGRHSLRYWSIDVAGNVEPANTREVSIDKSPPTITMTTPTQGSLFLLNQAVAASYSCSDDGGSGLASCTGSVPSGSYLDTKTAGSKVFVVNAADRAGNTAARTVNYSVQYKWGGFTQPVPEPIQTYKVGSTVPVKFQLFDANGAFVGGAKASLTVTTSTGGVIGGSRFTFDSKTQMYSYSLRTVGMPAGKTTLTVSLDDGTSHSVDVLLK